VELEELVEELVEELEAVEAHTPMEKMEQVRVLILPMEVR
jgi:hypothetical protein